MEKEVFVVAEHQQLQKNDGQQLEHWPAPLVPLKICYHLKSKKIFRDQYKCILGFHKTTRNSPGKMSTLDGPSRMPN